MSHRAPKVFILGIIAFLVVLLPAVAGETEALRLSFDDPKWELAGEGTVVEELDGEQALRLISGKATYRELGFLNGTVEFDLQVTEHRSFAYLYFRMANDEEHEEIYFRPHKSLLPDAIQYTPVYKGSSQWQLYHNAESTAAAPLPPGEWIHIKLVVEGSRAAVFVGSTEEPQLVISKLAREPKPGFIALRSFMTFGTPPDTYLASFANLVVHPGLVDFVFPTQEEEEVVSGQISSWEISSPFVPAEGTVLELPAEVLAGKWQNVSANSEGLVELERYLERPEGVRRIAVLARIRITAVEATTRRLDLGFSDEVSVFLNGRLLVADDESYSFNLPRRQGLLTREQLSVFLPLEKGANDLVLAITDRFGGWGVSGRLENPRDLAIAVR